MKGNLLQNFERYIKQNRFRRAWQKIVRVLACIVVFCTTYILILPAITAQQETLSDGLGSGHKYGLTAYARNTVQCVKVSTQEGQEIKEVRPIMVYGEKRLSEWANDDDIINYIGNSTEKWRVIEIRESDTAQWH